MRQWQAFILIISGAALTSWGLYRTVPGVIAPHISSAKAVRPESGTYWWLLTPGGEHVAQPEAGELSLMPKRRAVDTELTLQIWPGESKIGYRLGASEGVIAVEGRELMGLMRAAGVQLDDPGAQEDVRSLVRLIQQMQSAGGNSSLDAGTLRVDSIEQFSGADMLGIAACAAGVLSIAVAVIVHRRPKELRENPTE
jgi:hypothetical protein